MKYTKQELIQMAANATAVELYEYTDITRRIHTDTTRYVGNETFDVSELDGIEFDENGEAELDVVLMGKEEYENTIHANCCVSWDEMMEPDDTILVVVKR